MDKRKWPHCQRGSVKLKANAMVLRKDIKRASFMPFYGRIAYIPDGKVVGLSKLGRTVEVYAKRLD